MTPNTQKEINEKKLEVIFRPINKKQERFLNDTTTKEVLFGGAAGPGKTLCLVIFPLQFVYHPEFRGILFRREKTDTFEIVDRCIRYYTEFGGFYNRYEKIFYFPSGATIRISGMNREFDYLSFKGQQYNFIGYDELVQFTELQYIEMFHPSRSSTPDLPALIRATTNPDPAAVGHEWVKRRFIDPAKPGVVFKDEFKNSLITRLYIPSTILDNPVILKNNPDYIESLRLLPEHRQRQLIEGDWEVAENGAFIIDSEYHVDHDFCLEEAAKQPGVWEFIQSFDWGYRDPFASLWFAYKKDEDYMVLYRELYGVEKGRKDVGIRMVSSKVADLIINAESLERKLGIKIKYRIADPTIFNNTPRFRQGETQFLNTIAKDFEIKGVIFTPGNNDRQQGFAQVQKRLEITKEYDPETGLLLNVTKSFGMVPDQCPHFLRTMRSLTFARKGEDILKDQQEDHLYDAFRYACMFAIPKQIKAPKRHQITRNRGVIL